MALAKKEAMGDFSHLKNKKGEFIQQPLPQPTLPNISIDDELADIASLQQKRAASPSTNYTGVSDKYYAADAKASYDYPPMPAYTSPHSHLQDPNSHARYNPSATTLLDESQYYEDDYGSTAHLPLTAGSHGQQDNYNHPGQYHGSQGYLVDPYDVYTGHTANSHHNHNNSQYERQSGQQGFSQHPRDPLDDVNLAYDDNPAYPNPHTGQQQWHRPPSARYDGQFHAV